VTFVDDSIVSGPLVKEQLKSAANSTARTSTGAAYRGICWQFVPGPGLAPGRDSRPAEFIVIMARDEAFV
jgi:hypothetical protein